MEDPLIWTATIRRPFGVNGEVKVHTHNDEYGHLASLKVAVLRSSDGTELTVRVTGFRVVGGEPIMRFAGYESPEEARALNGMHLLVRRSEATPLKGGEFYTADLIGCTLYDGPESLGVVVSTVDGAQALLLEVKRADGSLALVPFHAHYIGHVDPERHYIELLTPWILA